MSDQLQFIADTIQGLDRKFEEFRSRVGDRLDEGNTRMARLEFGMRELNQREKERNGTLRELVKWREAMEMRDVRADERATVKAEARNTAALLGKRAWATVEKPVLYALAIGVVAGSAWTTRGILGLLQW